MPKSITSTKLTKKQIEKIAQKQFQKALKLIPISKEISYKLVWESSIITDDDEAFAARVWNESDLNISYVEIAAWRILDKEFINKSQAENYILSLFIHEITHSYFHDYFALLQAPEEQKKFLFERISHITEMLTLKLLEE